MPRRVVASSSAAALICSGVPACAICATLPPSRAACISRPRTSPGGPSAIASQDGRAVCGLSAMCRWPDSVSSNVRRPPDSTPAIRPSSASWASAG